MFGCVTHDVKVGDLTCKIDSRLGYLAIIRKVAILTSSLERDWKGIGGKFRVLVLTGKLNGTYIRKKKFKKRKERKDGADEGAWTWN
jgi:hypothetical protein